MKNQLHIGMLCHPTVGGSGILATTLGYELANLGHKITFISNNVPFRLKIEHPNITFDHVRTVDYPLFNHPDSTLPLINHLINKTREQHFDILHAHYAIPNAAAAVLAKRANGDSNVRIITTLHGTDVVKLGDTPEYSNLIQMALNGSDRITCVSNNLNQLTQNRFSEISNIKTIHNFYRKRPVTRSRNEIRSSIGVGDEPLVIHLSNLRKIKRIDLLLETFATARKKKKMKLLILSGADYSTYEEQVEYMKIGSDVIFMRDVVDIQNYIEASDMGLFCSEYESFCLGVLECMAHGLPVIAFDVGGISEVLKHEHSGFLFPFGNKKMMADYLVRLGNNDSYRKQLGENGQKRSQLYFSPETISQQYLQLYRQTTKETNSSSPHILPIR